MIKHNSASSVISPFNLVVTLNPKMRKRVNEEFIKPIIELFFSDKGGISLFSELDPDKLKTEVEFSNLKEQESFVKTYVYKEIMNEISKNENGIVQFSPKYLISFDRDLTRYKRDTNKYPYKKIFSKSQYKEEDIRFGVMRLGNIPILYFIYIELQEVIRYIKTLPQEVEKTDPLKIVETAEARRNKLIDKLVAKQYRAYINSPEENKQQEQIELARLINLSKEVLQGERGSLRVNLSWNTTDDLDLHINTDGGRKINYQNKILEYNGSIGKLDVDANAGGTLVSNPQENVSWDVVPMGKHTVSVNFYSDREKRSKVPFTVFVENGDESRIYNSFVESTGANKTRQIVEFEFKNGLLTFRELIH
ncbi:MAG: hypothetical protein EPGJADBJ_01091 [Saprospiraceae bacterium]|nr:hypothetical protein [Saprospiraceae bacterium]